MNLENMTVRAKLTAAFGGLAAIVLVVSAIAVRALGEGHDNYASYVGETGVRLSLANDVLDATNARAVAARNLVLVTTPADRASEKEAVSKAHEKVTATVARLKQTIATTAGVTEQERQLFAEIERVESRYGPVAQAIVNLALADKRDEAIGRMNTDCRPLLAGLITAANAYIAYGQTAATDEVKQAESSYATNRNLLFAACALAIGLALGLALVITRGLTRALGAEPAQLGQAAQRVAGGDLGPVVGADRAPAGSVLASLGAMQASLAQVVGPGAPRRRLHRHRLIAEIASGNADLSRRTEAGVQPAADRRVDGADDRHRAQQRRHRAPGHPAGHVGQPGRRKGRPGGQPGGGDDERHHHQLAQDRRHHRRDRRHRLPDQHPGAERRGGGGAGRRAGPRLSRWWPARCATWPSAAPKRPRRSSR
jgi:hypothetical protein